MTGFTPLQCGYGKQPIVVADFNNLVKKYEAEFPGCEIVLARPNPGWQSGNWDRVVIGLHDVRFRYPDAYGAIVLAAEARVAGIPVGLTLWDGDLRGMVHRLKRLSTVPGIISRMKFSGPNKAQAPWVMANLERIAEVVAEWTSGNWWAPLNLPAHGWGNHELLRQEVNGLVHCIDPARLRQDPAADPAPSREKARRWVYSSLKTSGKWWGRSWRGSWEYFDIVQQLGWVDESEVNRIMADSWGSLSFSYPHKGSGWWRQRYEHASRLGVVTATEPGEFPADSPYSTRTPAEIEGLSDASLASLAQQQADWYWRRVAPREEALQGILKYLEDPCSSTL